MLPVGPDAELPLEQRALRLDPARLDHPAAADDGDVGVLQGCCHLGEDVEQLVVTRTRAHPAAMGREGVVPVHALQREEGVVVPELLPERLEVPPRIARARSPTVVAHRGQVAQSREVIPRDLVGDEEAELVGGRPVDPVEARQKVGRGAAVGLDPRSLGHVPADEPVGTDVEHPAVAPRAPDARDL
jgi:hypothetical protein